MRNRPEIYSQLEGFGRRLAEGLAGAGAEAGVNLTTNRVGAMVTWFFTKEPVNDFASAIKSDTQAFGSFHRAMLDAGIWLPPSQFEAAFFSTAHTEADLAATIQAARASFAQAPEFASK